MPPTSSASPHGSSRVIWSLQARVDLELVVEGPAVREQLKNDAEENLDETEEHTNRECVAEEGRVGDILWYRGRGGEPA